MTSARLSSARRKRANAARAAARLSLLGNGCPPANTLQEQLTKYLTDAHSIEQQALSQLRTAPSLAGDPDIASAFSRHLAETEAQDAARSEEYRRRFTLALLQHPNVAATLEVLDIAGRPAVLQEWLAGLPGNDWPPLAAVPGVWYRLLLQAAQALHAAHEAGLVHGHLQPAQFVLTGDGKYVPSQRPEAEWRKDAAAARAAVPAALGQLMAGLAAQAPAPAPR